MADFGYADSVVQLDGSEIAKEKGQIGEFLLQLEGAGVRSVFQIGPTTAKGEGQIVFGTKTGQGVIDGNGFLAASGHGADQDGSGECSVL